MLNILAPYNREITQAMQDGYVTMLREKEAAKQNEYIKAREYYEGLHISQVTERTRQFLDLSRDAEFSANYCPMVVNAKADRLSVIGFETEDDTAKTLGDWWKRNRMDRLQGVVHRATVRDGDAFVLVEWDNVAKLPRFYFQPAYAGDGVMVYYSEERMNEVAFASKHWRINLGSQAGKMRRMNLYFPDRIEKYVSKDDIALGRWQPFLDENTEVGQGYLGNAGIVWWTDNGKPTGLPLGVPVIHFKNNDLGNGYGTSHLASIFPLQDALNKSLIDLISAMDVEGFGLLVGYGENWQDAKVGPGAIVSTETPQSEARLERLQGTNPVGMLAVYNALVMEIARVSGTPLSYLQSSGQVAAEGTMKQQEIALISQVEKAQKDFGNAWEDCMIMARRLNNVFNSAQLDENVLIETVWEEAVIRNEKEQAETLAVKVEKLGISQDQAQIELGYSEEQRAKFAREKLKAQAQAMRQMQSTSTQDEASAQNLSQTENETVDENPPEQ